MVMGVFFDCIFSENYDSVGAATKESRCGEVAKDEKGKSRGTNSGVMTMGGAMGEFFHQ